MIPKKTLGASNLPFKGSYREMVKRADEEHEKKRVEQEEYVAKVAEANRDPATVNLTHEEVETLRRNARKAERQRVREEQESSSKSAQPAESDSPEKIFIGAPEVLTDFSPRASLATPQGYDDLVQKVEDELFKMRRVLNSQENQQWILDNWTFLVHMLVKIVQNYHSEDFNVPPKG
jgi:hypothetical protein